MQQLDLCRSTLQFDVSNEKFRDCSAPQQTFYPLVVPRLELTGNNQAIGAAQRNGITVGGLRFSYNYALNNSEFWDQACFAGLDGVYDAIDIRSGLVVLPLKFDTLDTPAAESIPATIFNHDDTRTSTNTTPGAYFKPRVLYRALNQLWFTTPSASGQKYFPGATGNPCVDDRNTMAIDYSNSAFSTLQGGQEGAHPVAVKSKVTLKANEGLFWVVEMNAGFSAGEGTTFVLGFGFNFFGVAAVKIARTDG